LLEAKGLDTLDILLLERDVERSGSLVAKLEAVGCRVVALLHDVTALEAALDRHAADVVVVALAVPDAKLVQRVGRIGQRRDRPVAVFVEEADAPAIQAAVGAGVSSYVVCGSRVERLRAALEVARARFANEQALREDLASVRSTLADRKVIERAKGRLMKLQGLDEDAAYRALRASAMRRNRKIIDVARSVLERSAGF